MQGRGNAVSRALSPENPAYRANYAADLPSVRSESHAPSAESMEALDCALATPPVDLCRIAEQMGAHPEFTSMVMRLASSLLVSPEQSAATVEEAVVVLGTDRLRALLHIWSRFRQRWISQHIKPGVSSIAPSAPNDAQCESVNAESMPESLYLATFLRDLASDSSAPSVATIAARLLASGAQAGEFSELSQLFRDCISGDTQRSSR